MGFTRHSCQHSYSLMYVDFTPGMDAANRVKVMPLMATPEGQNDLLNTVRLPVGSHRGCKFLRCIIRYVGLLWVYCVLQNFEHMLCGLCIKYGWTIWLPSFKPSPAECQLSLCPTSDRQIFSLRTTMYSSQFVTCPHFEWLQKILGAPYVCLMYTQ